MELCGCSQGDASDVWMRAQVNLSELSPGAPKAYHCHSITVALSVDWYCQFSFQGACAMGYVSHLSLS
jgi:hypothetical protein